MAGKTAVTVTAALHWLARNSGKMVYLTTDKQAGESFVAQVKAKGGDASRIEVVVSTKPIR